MKKIYTFALALLASFTLALPAVADDDKRVTDDNVVTKKTVQDNNNGTYTLTLETYLQGEQQDIINPIDFVLLMDLSSSMNTYKIGDQTRLQILKTAAKSFVESLYAKENLPSNGEYHKLSLIGFSSTKGTIYYNQDASVDVTNNEYTKTGGIQSWLTNMNYTQGTRSDLGMKDAYDALAKLSDDGRPKVVVFFTDGCPSTSGGSNFTSSYAQAAVNYAYAMKQPLGSLNYTVTIPNETTSSKNVYTQYFEGTQYTLTKGLGATIYSVAILSSETSGANIADGDIENDIRRFLNYVSSNYNFPIKASGKDFDSNYFFGANYGTYGGDEGPSKYYSLSSGSDLSSIFKTIAEETIGGAKEKMDAESTVVLDVLTEEFRLFKNMPLSDIKLFTCDVKSDNTSETVAWKTNNGKEVWDVFKPWGTGKAEDYIFINKGPVSVPDGKEYIQVKGFNFSENFVGPVKNTSGKITGWHGKKLILQFDIEADPANPGGNSQFTNDAMSGVYKKDDKTGDYTVVEEYERPIVNLPYLRILKTGLEVGESAIFKVVKVKEDGSVDTTTPYEATVIISNDGGTYRDKEGNEIGPNALLKLVYTGYYQVTEVTNWTWAYDPTQTGSPTDPSTQRKYIYTIPVTGDTTVPEYVDAPFGSELNEAGEEVEHGEAYVLNYMSQGTKSSNTSTPGGGKTSDDLN